MTLEELKNSIQKQASEVENIAYNIVDKMTDRQFFPDSLHVYWEEGYDSVVRLFIQNYQLCVETDLEHIAVNELQTDDQIRIAEMLSGV